MSKPVILTGLRANNDLHIGNYLGALLPLIDMAKQKAGEYQVNLFVPDLHSFTTPIDHSQLQKQITDNLLVYAAAGLPLDNPDVYIYRQSYIPAHSELTWILDCFTGFGEMSRMTQFKDKSAKLIMKFGGGSFRLNNPLTEETKEQLDEQILETAQKSISVGLFNYPVLMAADILLYGAKYVPVGDDQTQHLEFTRDIAERLNAKFNTPLFTVPEPVIKQHEFFGKDQGLRIRDLIDPAKKMSKSDESGRGVIFLSDTPEVASKKVISATTDSLQNIQYDYKTQPGISNLLDIYKLLGGDVDEFIGQQQYGPFKAAVAEKVSQFLTDFQTKLGMVDQNKVMQKLTDSEQQMTQQASKTLLAVQQAVGLRA